MSKSLVIRVMDESVAAFKRDFAKLVALWALTDIECAQLCAADQMCLTVGSKPADWIIGDHDAGKGGWIAVLDEDKQYPVRFVDPAKRFNFTPKEVRS